MISGNSGPEEWRPAPGYENWYEVSDLGRVRRCRPGRGTRIGKILKQSPNAWGYLHVNPSVDGDHPVINVHLLVARAFIGPCPEGHEANHIDGVKANCAASNLEYITHSENMKHAYAIGIHPSRRGQKNKTYRGVPVEAAVSP